MRIEVIGSRGQLGRDVLRVLAESPHDGTGHSRADVDLTDARSVDQLMDAVRPDAVINCAAWTRVDAAESDEVSAWAANAAGPRNLAQACQRHGTLLCQLSTDYVFNGTASEPIDETSAPDPRSAYGRTKLAGEEAVKALCATHQIVRTSWLYGQDGPNFVLTVLRLAREGRPLRVVDDQWGSPTWTGHLARALIRLVEREELGTFHLSASGATTWHGFATAILEDAGLGVAVEPITTFQYPAPAARPQYSVLENARWRELGEAPLPFWRDGLREYLASLG